MKTSTISAFVGFVSAAAGVYIYKHHKKVEEEKKRLAEEREAKERQERLAFEAHKKEALSGRDLEAEAIKATFDNKKLNNDDSLKAIKVLTPYRKAVENASSITEFDICLDKFDSMRSRFTDLSSASLYVVMAYDEMMEKKASMLRQEEKDNKYKLKKLEMDIEEKRLRSEERYNDRLICCIDSAVRSLAKVATPTSAPINITLNDKEVSA